MGTDLIHKNFNEEHSDNTDGIEKKEESKCQCIKGKDTVTVIGSLKQKRFGDNKGLDDQLEEYSCEG